MRNVLRFPVQVPACTSAEAKEEPLLLTLYELHWLAVSVENQAKQEESMLRLLEKTRILADDPAWHERQVEWQRKILDGYQTLADKLSSHDEFREKPCGSN